MACWINVGLPLLSWAEAEPTSPSGLMAALGRLAFMTLLDCSTGGNLRQNRSRNLASPEPRRFVVGASGRDRRPEATRWTRWRKKCLRHSTRHHSHFLCSREAPRTVPSRRGDRAFVCAAPEPSGLRTQPGRPPARPAPLRSGVHCCRNPVASPLHCRAGCGCVCVLDVSSSGHTQVTCLSPELPRWLPATPRPSWDPRARTSRSATSFIFY